MVLCAPSADYKNKQFFTNHFSQHLPTQLQTWITWGTPLNPIYVLKETGSIKKNGTLATTFHKLAGESNTYVNFGYVPLKLFNHTQEQVLASINADPMNMIHTSQQPKQYGLNEEIEWDKNLCQFNCSPRNWE